MNNKLMNFINNNEKDFINWQQRHCGEINANPYIVSQAINTLGWFTQNWQEKVLSDGTKLNDEELKLLILGAINCLTLAMMYWMQTDGIATYPENKAFITLLEYQTLNPADFDGISIKARKYLNAIGA